MPIMTVDEALKLSEEQIDGDMVVLADTVRECKFGSYSGTDTRKHQETGLSNHPEHPGIRASISNMISRILLSFEAFQKRRER